MSPGEQKEIRRLMRAKRRALTHRELALAGTQLAHNLSRLFAYQRARTIAAYLAASGEIPLDSVIEHAWMSGKCVFLPRLRGAHLEFHRYTPDTRMQDNRFGIAEPEIRAHSRAPTRFLDIVLVPLVAFDTDGNRLGMGGGFYDRTFAFLRNRRCWRRPLLIGVGHEFQCLSTLSPAPWDVPLHAAVTDTRIRWFKN